MVKNILQNSALTHLKERLDFCADVFLKLLKCSLMNVSDLYHSNVHPNA